MQEEAACLKTRPANVKTNGWKPAQFDVCFILTTLLSHMTPGVAELGLSRHEPGCRKRTKVSVLVIGEHSESLWLCCVPWHETHVLPFTFSLNLQVKSNANLSLEALVSDPILRSSMEDAFARSIPEVTSFYFLHFPCRCNKQQISLLLHNPHLTNLEQYILYF